MFKNELALIYLKLHLMLCNIIMQRFRSNEDILLMYIFLFVLLTSPMYGLILQRKC